MARQDDNGGPIGAEGRHVAGAILGLTAVITLLVAAFAWPATNAEPRDVPLVVAGPAEATGGLAAQLDQRAPGAFDVQSAADRSEAVRLIEDREAYGALVTSPEGVEVLTASAASPAVAQLLNALADEIGAAGDVPVGTSDVVPAPADDPRGAGISAGSLPLVLAGVATAFALVLRIRGGGGRLVGLAGVAVGAGLAATAVLQSWLGALDGSYWANAAVIALGVAAMATALVGLGRLLGLAGVGLGAVTMVALGNPLSGLTSAPEMLPEGWGTFGQLLPPGAMGTALRSTAFFDGAGSGPAFLVLGCWVIAGLVCYAAGSRLAGRRAKPARDDRQ